MAYFAVIGRLIGDDEDSCHFFTGDNWEEVTEKFNATIRGDAGEAYTNEDSTITHILKSETPIGIGYSIGQQSTIRST